MTPILLNRRGLIFGIALAMLYISIVPSYLHAGGSQSGNTTYYVQAGGSDGNDGLSRETSFQTLGKAVDTAKRSRIKRITVIGALMESSEQRTSFSRDPESVFFIKDSGRAEITIRGISRAGLNGAGSNKRVIKITGRSNIRFEYITLSNGLLNASNRGNGGGLYISDNAVITFGSGAVVTENSAVQGGGVFVLGSESAQARLILAGGRIVNNRAEGSIGEAGAGVYMHYGSCRILAGEITGNVAVDDNGGGLLLKQGSIEMTGGLVSDNIGGGIYVVSGAFTMHDGIIQNNRASHNAGGVALALSDFTMTGGSILNNTAASAGGGVFVFQSTYTLSGGEIANNTAEYGGGVCIDATDSNNSVDFAMTGGSIHHNQAKESGGGVFILNGTINLSEKAELNNNIATSGGGVAVENGTLNIKDETLIQNNILSGNGHGGGVYVTTGHLNLTGGRIVGNSGLYGGGVSAMDCTFTMNNTAAIIGNTASNSGGGVFFGNGTFEMNGGEIANNVTHNSGGGLYVGGYCTVLLAGGVITNNQSAKEGGGIDVRAYNIVTLTGVTLSGNRAEKGGAVHVWEQGVFNIWNNDLFNPQGGAIIGNEAYSGGGVYIDKGGDLTQNGGSLGGNKPDDIIWEHDSVPEE